jgi:hypothetical protein
MKCGREINHSFLFKTELKLICCVVYCGYHDFNAVEIHVHVSNIAKLFGDIKLYENIDDCL